VRLRLRLRLDGGGNGGKKDDGGGDGGCGRTESRNSARHDSDLARQRRRHLAGAVNSIPPPLAEPDKQTTMGMMLGGEGGKGWTNYHGNCGDSS
jgi:hypothetical protein